MNNKYITRRNGQLVGTYTDKEQALAECLPGDKVFEVIETHGDFGCITEYQINKQKTTKESNMKPKITQGVKSAVNAYFMARTLAECEREKVDKIARSILETAAYYAGPKFIKIGFASERITEPDNAWMLGDKEHHDYLLDLRKALQNAGYVIKSIPDEPEYSYKCPALTAESLQRDTEHLLIEAVCEMIGEKDDLIHNLLCAGMDKYNQFIDLSVKMVVNMPGFKNPLPL